MTKRNRRTHSPAFKAKVALAALKGIEDAVWVQVEGCPKVYAIADEDLERENDVKTSSVHFVRFQLSPEMIAALRYGVTLAMGIEHSAYSFTLRPVAETTRKALLADLQ